MNNFLQGYLKHKTFKFKKKNRKQLEKKCQIWMNYIKIQFAGKRYMIKFS